MGTSHVATWVWHISSYPSASPTRIRLHLCPPASSTVSTLPFLLQAELTRLPLPLSTSHMLQPRSPHGAGPGLQTQSHRYQREDEDPCPGPAGHTLASPQRRGWRRTAPRRRLARLTAQRQHLSRAAAAMFVVAPRKARWDLKAAAAPGLHAPGQVPEKEQRRPLAPPAPPLHRARDASWKGQEGTVGHGRRREPKTGRQRGPGAGAHSLLGVVVRRQSVTALAGWSRNARWEGNLPARPSGGCSFLPAAVHGGSQPAGGRDDTSPSRV